MEGGYEDIARNTFFQTFVAKHNDLYQLALQNNWFVCIPQKSSLRGVISRKDFETHVLKPSKTFPGEFITFNGRTVNIVGNKIVTKAGFPTGRTAKILFSEEHAGSAFENSGKFHILHLGRPLEGGVDAPSGTEEMNRAVIQKIIGMLRSYPEHESVFLRLNEFIAETKEYFDFYKGRPLHPKFEDFVQFEMQYACETFLNSSCFRNLQKSSRKRQRAQLLQVLESYIMEGIHDVVFKWIAKEEEAHDLELTKILSGMSSWTQHDLGMRIEFQCPQDEAVMEFSKLTAAKTPLEKMLRLNGTHALINRGVERNLTSRYLDIGAHQMTTDDLLDQLIFVIICVSKRCNDRSYLAANIKYMQRFHLLHVNTSVLGYNQANLEVAIGWFLLKRRSVERPLWVKETARIGTIPSLDLSPHYRRRQNSVDTGGMGAKGTPYLTSSNSQRLKVSFSTSQSSDEEKMGEGLLLGDSGLVSAHSMTCGGDQMARSVGEALQVACGGHFFVKLDAKGYVWTWGVPNCGRMGWHGVANGNDMENLDAESICDVSLNASSSLILKTASTSGSTANNDMDLNPVPVLIPSLRSVYIVEISCGTHHTVVRAANGTLFSWGDNRHGQLGIGISENDSNIPVKVDLTDCAKPQISSVSCGSSHTLAITIDGAVIAWGNGKSGRLGTGSSENSSRPSLINKTTDGVHLGVAAALVGGFCHSLVVLLSGQVFSWGCGADGRLGGGSYSDQMFPSRVLFFGSKPIDKGRDHEFHALEHSPVSSPSSFEQVGDMFLQDKSAEAYNKPAYALAEREPPLDIRITKVAAGYAHSVFLSNTGHVYVCGSGESGQLGLMKPDGTKETVCLVPRPVKIDYPLNTIIVDIACGDHHSACLTEAGELLTWGLNKTNACGLDPDDFNNASPIRNKTKDVGSQSYLLSSPKKYAQEQLFPAVSGIFKRTGRTALRLDAGPSTTSVIVLPERE